MCIPEERNDNLDKTNGDSALFKMQCIGWAIEFSL